MGHNMHTGQEIVSPMFNDIRTFAPGLAVVAVGERYFPGNLFEPVRFIGQWGLINSAGEMILHLKYDFIGDLRLDNIFGEWVREYYVPINIGGNWAPGRGGDFFNDDIIVGGRWGIVDLKGNLVIPTEMKFDEIGHITESMIAVKHNGRWGFVRLEK